MQDAVCGRSYHPESTPGGLTIHPSVGHDAFAREAVTSATGVLRVVMANLACRESTEGLECVDTAFERSSFDARFGRTPVGRVTTGRHERCATQSRSCGALHDRMGPCWCRGESRQSAQRATSAPPQARFTVQCSIPGWPPSPPPMVYAQISRIRSIWAASYANCGGWSGRSLAGRKDQPTEGKTRRQVTIASERGIADTSGLALQAGFGVGARESSDPRRRPQHRGNGEEPSALPGDQRCRLGRFVKIVMDKADHYGRTVDTVSRWLASTKTCADCAHRLEDLPLQIRRW